MTLTHTSSLRLPGFAISAKHLLSVRRAATLLAIPALGCGIAALQLCATLSLQAPRSLPDAYERLHQWDSALYEGILENGYRSSLPRGSLDGLTLHEIDQGTNVAFYPGYPLVGRIIAVLTGLRARHALLLAAQIANAFFWTYVLLFLRKWRIRTDIAATAVLSIALYPTAFFLVAAYSESLFLASILGFLYWSSRTSSSSGVLAVLHGLVMTATRIMGLPLVAAPLIGALSQRPERSESERLVHPAAISLWSALGGLFFFLYCAHAFGHWDLYMQRQLAGWGIRPDYGFFLHASSGLYWPDTFREWLMSDHLSKFATPVIFYSLAGLLPWQLFTRSAAGRRNGSDRWAFFWCAFMLLYISAAGLSGSGMRSMIRYTFPVYVLIVLALVNGLRDKRMGRVRRVVAGIGITVVLCLFAAAQYMLLIRFANGDWVA